MTATAVEKSSTKAITTQRLTELETIVERGLQTFIEVGEALREIRDTHLYSEGSFEDYCRKRWGFTDRRARQLMQAAEIGTIVPVGTESQARELAPLKADPDQMSEAWEEASADGKPTAAKVKEAVTQRTEAVVEVPSDDDIDDVVAGVDGEVAAPLESPSTTVDDEAKALIRAFLTTWEPTAFESETDIQLGLEVLLPKTAWDRDRGEVREALADAYEPYIQAINRINTFIHEEIAYEEKGLTAITDELALITPLLSDNLDGTGACWIVHLEDMADVATRLWRQLDSAISGEQD